MAIPQQSTLEIIVDVVFDASFNELTQGDPVYSNAIYKLVQSADTQGKLLELAIKVILQNRGSPEFQDYIGQNLLLLLSLESRLLSGECLQSLVSQLRTIKDVEGITQCCRQTWPNLEVARRKIWQHLEQSTVCEDAEWLMVLGLWLKIYPYRGDATPSILAFVQRLFDCVPLDDDGKKNLDAWLGQAQTELGCTLDSHVKTLTSSQKALLKVIRGYCVIDVEILETKEEMQPRCQLHVQVGQDNEFEEDERFQISNLTSEELSQISTTDTEPCALSADETICYSPRFVPIREQILHWLKQAQIRLKQKCQDLKQRYELRDSPIFDLLVEFCLPWEHLVEGVDAWEFSTQVRRRLTKVRIGRKYKVVVRARDRIHDIDGSLINQLKKVWDDNEALLRSGEPKSDEWKLKSPILKSFERLKAVNEDILIREFEQYLGMGLTCPLCLVEHGEAREIVLNAVLEAGVPVVVWSRNHEIPDLSTQLRELLAVECFSDFNILMERAAAKRGQASDDHSLGNHLAVWCDDPQRIETLNELFSKGGLG